MNDQDRIQQELKRKWRAFLEKEEVKRPVLLFQDAATFRRPILGAVYVVTVMAVFAGFAYLSLPFLSLATMLTALFLSLRAVIVSISSDKIIQVVDLIESKLKRTKLFPWQVEGRSINEIASLLSEMELHINSLIQFVTYRQRNTARKNVMLATSAMCLVLSFLFSRFTDTSSIFIILLVALVAPVLERLKTYQTHKEKAFNAIKNTTKYIGAILTTIIQYIPIDRIVYDRDGVVGDTQVYTPQPSRQPTLAGDDTIVADENIAEDLTASVTTRRRENLRQKKTGDAAKVSLSSSSSSATTVTTTHPKPTAPPAPVEKGLHTQTHTPPPYSLRGDGNKVKPSAPLMSMDESSILKPLDATETDVSSFDPLRKESNNVNDDTAATTTSSKTRAALGVASTSTPRHTEMPYDMYKKRNLQKNEASLVEVETPVKSKNNAIGSRFGQHTQEQVLAEVETPTKVDDKYGLGSLLENTSNNDTLQSTSNNLKEVMLASVLEDDGSRLRVLEDDDDNCIVSKSQIEEEYDPNDATSY
eukprot:m.83856 g.83856  ORF g.83856 m.83856 type:complete len:531 (+) comp12136_c1_seq1:132-1724(+)